MKITILLFAVFLAAIIIPRFFKRRISDFIPSDGLRSFLVFLLVCAIIWFNRYSFLTLIVMLHLEHPFTEAMKLSFPMDNGIQFFVDSMYEACAAAGKEIPKYLDKSVQEMLAGGSEFVEVIGNLFELVLLAW